MKSIVKFTPDTPPKYSQSQEKAYVEKEEDVTLTINSFQINASKTPIKSCFRYGVDCFPLDSVSNPPKTPIKPFLVKPISKDQKHLCLKNFGIALKSEGFTTRILGYDGESQLFMSEIIESLPKKCLEDAELLKEPMKSKLKISSDQFVLFHKYQNPKQNGLSTIIFVLRFIGTQVCDLPTIQICVRWSYFSLEKEKKIIGNKVFDSKDELEKDQKCIQWGPEGFRVYSGFLLSLVETTSGIRAIIDLTHAVVLPEISLKDYLDLLSKKLGPSKNATIAAYCKDLKVTLSWNGHEKRINGVDFRKTPVTEKFKDDTGAMISVKDYYLRKYNRKIDGTLPLAFTNQRGKYSYFPVDLLIISKWQTPSKEHHKKIPFETFLKEEPGSRAKKIENFVSKSISEKVFQELGYEIESNFATVKAKILPPFLFKNNIGMINDGTWYVKKFSKWNLNKVITAFMVFTEEDLAEIKRIVDLFEESAKSYAEEFNWGPKYVEKILENPQVEKDVIKNENFIFQLNKSFQKLKKCNVGMVVIILPTSLESLYNHIKAFAGNLATQAILRSNLGKLTTNFMSNLIFSMNPKVEGVNWELIDDPDISKIDAILVGMDACHKDNLSIAAVVISTIQNSPKIEATWSDFIKTKKNDSSSDIMEQAGEAICKFIRKAYFETKKPVPSKIIILRDGVSDSMIELIKEREVKPIKKALGILFNGKKAPELTVIVCQKRNSTRSFTQSFKNPKMGTHYQTLETKSKDLTKAYPQHCYLQPHAVTSGTANIGFYIIIHSEFILDQEIFVKLMFYLSQSYQPKNSTISHPYIIKYADNLAELLARTLYNSKIHQEHFSESSAFNMGHNPLCL